MIIYSNAGNWIMVCLIRKINIEATLFVQLSNVISEISNEQFDLTKQVEIDNTISNTIEVMGIVSVLSNLSACIHFQYD